MASESSNQGFFNYRHAIVRRMAASFAQCEVQVAPKYAIDVVLADRQHAHYVEVLRGLVRDVHELPADDAHPDCNFVEDTAVMLPGAAVLCRMGAASRRGEEQAIAELLTTLAIPLLPIAEPGTIDGGDVMFSGAHLFVGISSRTNEPAFRQVESFASPRGVQAFAIPVCEGLHLKSVVSLLDQSTIVVADTAAGRAAQEAITAAVGPRTYEFLAVPDLPPANVLRIGDTVLIQKGFERSDRILTAACQSRGLEVIRLSMSELIKADGALTCGSLLW